MSSVTDFGDQLLGLMLVYGYPIFALTLLLGAIGLPVPSSLVASVSGALAANGELDPAWCLILGVLACVLGDMVGYSVGRFGGRELAERHGRWIGLGQQRLVQSELLFRRWAVPTLLLSRSLVAIVGPAVNLLAGATHQPLRVFVRYDLLGRIVWVTAYFTLGYAFAGKADVAADLVSSVSGVVGVLGLALLAFVANARSHQSGAAG